MNIGLSSFKNKFIALICAIVLCTSLLPLSLAPQAYAEPEESTTSEQESNSSTSEDRALEETPVVIEEQAQDESLVAGEEQPGENTVVPLDDEMENFEVGDTFTYACPFEPTDISSTDTDTAVNFKVASYDEDTHIGTVTATGLVNTAAAGAITFPDSFTKGGATFTITGLDSYSFTTCTGLTDFNLPNTLETIGDSAISNMPLMKHLVLPESIKAFTGRGNFGGPSNSAAWCPDVIEWTGDASAITSSRDSAQFIRYCAGKRLNHIFWGDAGLESSVINDAKVGPVYQAKANAINAGLYTSSQQPASSYVWFPVTYYPSQADAVAQTNAIGTAYVSFSHGQTNTSTMTNATLKTQAHVTLSEILDETLDASQYFFVYDGSLSDYPQYPSGTDKWVIAGNPDPANMLLSGVSAYAVKTDTSDIAQGYISGLQKTYRVTASDVTPFDVDASQGVESAKLFDATGAQVAAGDFDISYQRYDTQSGTWVDAPAGQRGTLLETYRMVLTGKNGKTGTLTTDPYQIKGYSVDEDIVYQINHTAADGTKDTIPCTFTVLTEPTKDEPGTLTTKKAANANEATARAIALDTEGSIELPGTITLAGVDYDLTEIGAYSFGNSTAARACTDLTGVTIPNTVTTLNTQAFCNCPLRDLVIPESMTIVGSAALSISNLTPSSYGSITFLGNASNLNDAKTPYNAIITKDAMDLLYCGDSALPSKITTITSPITNWYSVDYYADAASAEAAGEPLASVFVKEGTRIYDVLNSSVPAFYDEGAPALPSGTRGWAVYDSWGLGLDEQIDHGSVSVYASNAADTDLSTAYADGAQSKYWTTGVEVKPTCTVHALSGATIEASRYQIAYERYDADTDTWSVAADGTLGQVGSYRLHITPASGSTLTGELFVPYEVKQSEVGELVTADIENILPNGTSQQIPCVFKVLTVADGTTSVGQVSVSVASNTQRAIGNDTQGTIVIPKSIALGEEIYDVISIDAKAFYRLSGITGIDLPEGLETIKDNAFTGVNVENYVIPSTFSSSGGRIIDDSAIPTLAVNEVVFKGSVPASITSLQNSFSYSTYSTQQNINYLLEDEKNSRATLNVDNSGGTSGNLKYYQVKFYESQAAMQEGVSLGSVFMLEGAYLDEIDYGIDDDLYNGNYNDGTIPELPATSSGQWIYMDLNGSQVDPADTEVDRCYSAYASAPENSITNYRFEVNVKDAKYPATGSNIIPDYGCIQSMTGEVLDPVNYTVSYQRQDPDGVWVNTTDGASEGQLRLRVRPTAASGLVDELYSQPYEIVEVEDPTIQKFSYPVSFVPEVGAKRLVNGTFTATSDSPGSEATEWCGSAPTDAIGVDFEGHPGLVVPDESGELVLPSSMNVGGKDYTLTSIGDYAYVIEKDSTDTTLSIPSTVTSISSSPATRFGFFDRANVFDTVLYDGDCNLSNISTTSFKVGYSATSSVVFGGTVSSYIDSIVATSKNHGEATSYGKVLFYEDKQDYIDGNVEAAAIVGVELGTTIGSISLDPSSVNTFDGMDDIPDFPGDTNTWKFVGLNMPNTQVHDGTFVAYAETIDDDDLSKMIPELNEYEFTATGDDIEPVATLTNIVTAATIPAEAYTKSYERLGSNNLWAPTTDLASPGTLRIRFTATDTGGYTGELVSDAYVITSIDNTDGEIFSAMIGYLDNTGNWQAGDVATSEVPCTMQILKPASSDENGLVQVSRGSKLTNPDSYYKTDPAVDPSLTGTIIIPDEIKTSAGTFTVVAAAMGGKYHYTEPYYSASEPFVGWNKDSALKLRGIVMPATLDAQAAIDATADWYTPIGGNSSDGMVTMSLYKMPNNVKIYFPGDVSGMRANTYSLTDSYNNASLAFYSGAFAGEDTNTLSHRYCDVTYYEDKDAYEAGDTPLGRARILDTTVISNLRYGSYLSDGGTRPALPAGMDAWKIVGNYAQTDTLDTGGLIAYGIVKDTNDLSQATFVDAETSKMFDGTPMQTTFTVHDVNGAAVASSDYTVSYQRQDSEGNWTDTTDLTGIGVVRVSIEAVDGSGYTGGNSYEFEITSPTGIQLDMPLTAPDGTEGTTSVNCSVTSVDNDNKIIEVAVAPAADGSKAVSPLTEGTLTVPESVTYGGYTVKVVEIEANAFGDETQENACNNLTGLVLSAGPIDIDSGAFTKCQGLADIVFAEGSEANVAADAFADAGVQAVDFKGDATQVAIDDEAFTGCADITKVAYESVPDTDGKVWGESSPASYYPVSYYDAEKGTPGIVPDAVLLLKEGCDPQQATSADLFDSSATVPEPTDGTVWVCDDGYDPDEGLEAALAVYTKPTFTIDDVSGIEDSYEYTGEAIAIDPVVVVGETTLVEDSDYTVSISDADGNSVTEVVDAGDYVVTLTAIGDYAGTVEKEFSVVAPVATSVVRLYGETSGETAAAIVSEAWGEGETSQFAVLVRDDDFADAMSATGLAGALDAPIILTDRNSLSGVAKDQIERLDVSTVYVIGGVGAMPGDFEGELADCGVTTVERIFGSNSYDTSVECAKRIAGLPGAHDKAIVAMSSNFQDALSMSSFAYKYGVPIFLETFGPTSADRQLPAEAVTMLTASGDFAGAQVYVAGGTGAVSQSSIDVLGRGDGVVRLSGETGYDTSNAIANYMVDNLYLSAGTTCIASGAENAKGLDALAGAALAGRKDGVMLLVSGNPAIEPENYVTIDSFLEDVADDVNEPYLLGGTYVLPDQSVLDRVKDVLGIE